MTDNIAAPHLEAQPISAPRTLPGARRPNAERIALIGLFTLGVLYTLHVVRDLLLPVAMALLLSLLLRPVVKGLRRIGLPEPAGAALVVAALLAAVAAGVYGLKDPARTWMKRAPVIMLQIEFKLDDLRESIEAAREATRQIEEIAAPSAGTAREPVVVRGPTLAEQLLSKTQVLFAGLLITLVLLFFFLAQGRQMVERVLAAMPSIEKRMHYAQIANTVRQNIGAYLATVTLINLALGCLTAIAMTLLGMPNPVLWGVMAGVLNFIPYLGSAVSVVVIGVVSALTFDTWGTILLPPLTFLTLTALEGNFVTPMIVGRRLTLNPIAVFLAILFWGWLWGVPGALLAVPILAVFKIICDAHTPLHALGALLDGRPT